MGSKIIQRKTKIAIHSFHVRWSYHETTLGTPERLDTSELRISTKECANMFHNSRISPQSRARKSGGSWDALSEVYSRGVGAGGGGEEVNLSIGESL